MTAAQRGRFVKLGLRRAQAISVIDLAIVLTLEGNLISDARIALGALAPTIVRAEAAEAALIGQEINPGVCRLAAALVQEAVSPIDDVRASGAYRLRTLDSLVAVTLAELAESPAARTVPDAPVLLETSHRDMSLSRQPFAGSIDTVVNGSRRLLTSSASCTLLDALRDEAGLTGTKEGCAEGECGACTVWLNGQAVMACLVPAPQAHGATVTTIEGLNQGDELHPLQEQFVAQGAVQCGYCIPGMLMAGAKLLQEKESPALPEIQTALSGNICRCTGYRKIFSAVTAAGSAS